MEWRRWDNLEEQSLQVIPQLVSKEATVDIVPPKSITRLISSRQYTIGPEPGSPRINIELSTEKNLDPFRNDTSGRQNFLHNLRSARAVIP